MRATLLIPLLLGLGAGGASGYLAGAAELQPGTYYIELGRAVQGVPGFQQRSQQQLEPIRLRIESWNQAKAAFDEDEAAFALLEPGTAEHQGKQIELAVRQESLIQERQVLEEAMAQIQESLLYLASRKVHEAAAKLGERGGYEHIVIEPIQVADIPWDKPNEARELLRQRQTLWVHPDRDLTDELLAILSE